MKYFTYDHNGNGFELYETKEEAKSDAKQLLDYYLKNDNHDLVDICWGEIKESVHSNDAALELKAIEEQL